MPETIADWAGGIVATGLLVYVVWMIIRYVALAIRVRHSRRHRGNGTKRQLKRGILIRNIGNSYE